jgi:DNA polymerase-3 subunit delta
MAAWNYDRLKREMASDKIAEIYLLFGEESFLINEALDELKTRALGAGLADFNYNLFFGQELNVGDLRDAIETLPMMASKRVVVLKEAQALKTKDFDALLPLLEDPIDSTTFIMVSSQVDKRKKFYKTIEKKGAVVEFKRPYENQVPQWIDYISKKHGKRLTSEAKALMQQFVGTSLLEIDNEMRKLAQYSGAREQIEAQDIEEIVSKLRVDSVFALANAIGSNDRSTALFSLANLLEHGENAIGVLAMITRHFRILMLVQEGLKEGHTQASLCSRVGVPSFFIRQYIEQSKKWDKKRLDSTYQSLLQTDKALKSSPTSAHIWLENFILKVCH